MGQTSHQLSLEKKAGKETVNWQRNCQLAKKLSTKIPNFKQIYVYSSMHKLYKDYYYNFGWVRRKECHFWLN